MDIRIPDARVAHPPAATRLHFVDDYYQWPCDTATFLPLLLNNLQMRNNNLDNCHPRPSWSKTEQYDSSGTTDKKD